MLSPSLFMLDRRAGGDRFSFLLYCDELALSPPTQKADDNESPAEAEAT
jgi:hypothetical protein